MTNSPTPWTCDHSTGGVFAANMVEVLRVFCDHSDDASANELRVVACVNACEGISTDILAGWTVASGISVQQQRDALFATIEELSRARVERDALLAAMRGPGPAAQAARARWPGYVTGCDLPAVMAENEAAPVALILTREQAQALAQALDYDLSDLSTVTMEEGEDGYEDYQRVKQVRAILEGFGL